MSSSKSTAPTAIPAAAAAAPAAAAARGTLWSVGLRLLSFICTQITLRWVDPVALGKANIDLELAFGFILFFSREGFRLVLAKQWNVQLAYTTRYLHALVALVTWIWLCSYNNNKSSTNRSNDHDVFDYRLAATLYCIAACMEGWAEPRILKCLFDMRLDHKVYAEGMATVTKTLVTVCAIYVLDDRYPVTAFGVAQIGYALVYNVVLYRRVSDLETTTTTTTTIMKVDDDNDNRNKTEGSLTTLQSQVILFTLQGLFKHALTEGDRILLVLMLSEGYDKGLYALASAYGGMAARLVFQPLEENSRLLWSKLVVVAKQNTKVQQHQLFLSYTSLVKLVLYVGLLLATLGSNYTDILLQVLGGPSRRPAARVLSAFCVYTLAMALNGMTEAFWYAAAGSRDQVGRLSVVQLGIGIVTYGGLAPILVSKYGTVGLVWANVVAMLLRSLYAMQFAADYFQLRNLLSLIPRIVPHPVVLMGFLVMYGCTSWSLKIFLERELTLNSTSTAGDMRFSQWLALAAPHIGVGVTCLVGVASLVATLERPYFRSLRNLLRDKKD